MDRHTAKLLDHGEIEEEQRRDVGQTFAEAFRWPLQLGELASNVTFVILYS